MFLTPNRKCQITNILLRYDGPKIFIVKDEHNNRCLVTAIDWNDEAERWFMIPVSNERLHAILSGNVSLRQAEEQSECGWVWDYWMNWRNPDKSEIKMLSCQDIKEEEKPSVDSFL